MSELPAFVAIPAREAQALAQGRLAHLRRLRRGDFYTALLEQVTLRTIADAERALHNARSARRNRS